MPSDPGTTSTSLIRGLQRHDNAAWTRFLMVYRPCLISLCERGGAPRGQAEDVADAAALKIFLALPVFRRRRSGSFRAWLRTIVDHELANHFARANTEGPFPIEPFVTLDDDEAYDELAVRAWKVLEQQVSEGRFTEQTVQAFIEHKLRQRPASEVAAETDGKLTANAVYQAAHRVMVWLESIGADQWLDHLAVVALPTSESPTTTPPN